MLNKDKIRELAYVAQIKSIDPIQGSDNCESVTIDGWHIMAKKGEFKVGDKCVYFEIDSLLDTSDQRFAFMEKYHGKVKTQKYTFGGKGLFYSQGLIMRLSDLGLSDDKYEVGDFLTAELNVKYYEQESQKRKGDEVKTYKPFFNKLKKKKFIKKMMKYSWFRNLMVLLFGVKKKRTQFPNFVKVSDEERCQNLTKSIYEDKETTYELSEKLDGSSTTVAIERIKGNKYKLFICSRKVVVWDSIKKKTSKGGYYSNIIDVNPYVEMAEKYKLREFLIDYMDKHSDVKWAYLQGETFGKNIQKRTYNLNGRDFRAFTFVDSVHNRFTYSETKEILDAYNIPTVPILMTNYVIADNSDELIELAGSEKSIIDGGMREGIVFRSEQNPTFSFKAVDPNFLVKYHG